MKIITKYACLFVCSLFLLTGCSSEFYDRFTNENVAYYTGDILNTTRVTTNQQQLEIVFEHSFTGHYALRYNVIIFLDKNYDFNTTSNGFVVLTILKDGMPIESSLEVEKGHMTAFVSIQDPNNIEVTGSAHYYEGNSLALEKSENVQITLSKLSIAREYRVIEIDMQNM